MGSITSSGSTRLRDLFRVSGAATSSTPSLPHNCMIAVISAIDQALSEILGVNVLVGAAIYTATNEGQTSITYAPILDDDILLLYVTPSPGLFEASAGYTITWAPGGGLGSMQPVVRLGENDADLIKYKMQIAHEIVASYVGYYVADVTD